MNKYIVTADDYGIYPAIDAGIKMAIRAGKINSVAAISNYLTSVHSVMELLEEHNHRVEIGCHLTITSGKPVTGAAAISLCEGDYFRPYDEFKRAIDLSALENELHAQIDVFLNEGIPVRHLSSHHNALTLFPEVFDVYLKVARAKQLPIRSVCQVPQGKQNLYIAVLQLMLLDDLTLRDLADMRRFNRQIVDYFNDNGQGIDSPDVLNSSHYGPIPAANVPPSRVDKKAKKKRRKLKRQFNRFARSEHDNMEIMVHIIRGSSNQIADYPGINTKYFDSRSVEFESVMNFDFDSLPDVERGSWGEL